MAHYQYQVGGSLTIDAPSYVVRQADRELYQALKQGEFCYILDSRQMGKSSLLMRTKHQLKQEGYHCSAIDLTRIGSTHLTPLQWYKGIAAELWRGFHLIHKVDLHNWWAMQHDMAPVQKLGYFIEDILFTQFPQGKIFIFIDEIDKILSLDFSTDDFFGLIRFCYNQRANYSHYRRLSFAIFGVAYPADLISNKVINPFNIGNEIKLAGFKLDEVSPLIEGLKVKLKGDQNQILDQILAWTGGQPFLTQKICNLIVQQSARYAGIQVAPGSEKIWVENLVTTFILNRWESQDEPEHLKTIRDRIDRKSRLAVRMLAIYQKVLKVHHLNNGMLLPKFDDSPEQIELLLSGLLIREDGFLNIKNHIYAHVFNLEWVEYKLALLRPYSQHYETWIESGQQDESCLLKGKDLQNARRWSQDKSLGDLDYQFLARSEEIDRQETQKILEKEREREMEARLTEQKKRKQEEERRRIQERKTAQLQRWLLAAISIALVIVSGLGLTAFKQYEQAVNSEIRAIVTSSEALFTSNQKLDSLLEAIRAKQQLQKLNRILPKVKIQIDNALRQAIYGVDEYNRLVGHNASIFDLNFSPDGSLIASASGDHTVKLWKPDGTLLQTLWGHGAKVWAIDMSPDGQKVVTGSDDRTAKLWQNDGTLLHTFQGHDAGILDVKFSPDGNRIATASLDNTLKLWKLDGSLLKTLNHQTGVQAVAFSPSGSILATATLDGTAYIWNRKGALLATCEGHDGTVLDIAISPTARILATASTDKTIKLWTFNGTLLKTLKGHNAPIWSVAFSSDGDMIASASEDKTIKLWGNDGTLLKTLEGHESNVYTIAFSPDAKTLASAGSEHIIRLWKLYDPLSTHFQGHDGQIVVVKFSPDGSTIATGSADRTVKLWQHDGKLLMTLKGHSSQIFDLDIGETANTIVSMSVDGTINFWISDGNLVTSFNNTQAKFHGIAVSSNGALIGVNNANGIAQVWQKNGKKFQAFRGCDISLADVAFSPDKRLIATVDDDNQIKIWQRNGKLVQTISGHKDEVLGIKFSSDNALLATYSVDKTAKLWKLDGTLVSILKGHHGPVQAIAFSSDRRLIATASADQTIKLWQQDGTLLKTLNGHRGAVLGVDFSPDGMQLASVGDDQIGILWNLDQILSLDELAYACDWVQDYLLTNAELGEHDRHLCDEYS